MTPVGVWQVVSGTAGLRIQIPGEARSLYSAEYGVHPPEPLIVPSVLKVAVMVLPSITFDHTPLVSSYHPSFQIVPVIDRVVADGTAACCTVLTEAGVVEGLAGGEVVQPLISAVTISRPIHIQTICLIFETVLSMGT